MTPNLYRVILPVDGLDGAGAFWSRILGLEVDPSVSGRHYIRTGGAILVLVDTGLHRRMHGLAPVPFRPQPDWLYFRVPDLDATWEIAQELGCPPPRDDEGVGIHERVWGDRSFYTYDPCGNPVCFVDDVRSESPRELGRYVGKPIANLCKVILPTKSMGRSGAFFEEMLGIEPDTFVPNRHFFRCDSCELALVNPIEHAASHEIEPGEFRPNPDVVYFAVSDLDATWETSQKLGMAGEGIRERPWGERSFYGLDPSGNPICFVDERNLYTGAE